MTDHVSNPETNDQDGTVKERFRHVQFLGYGGMASVYRAYDTLLRETVALKVLHPHLSSPMLLARFKREVLLSRKIAHKHLLRLYDVVEFDNKFGITMEYMGGGTLKELIDTRHEIDITKSLSMIRDITSGLETAHRQGILHRDIKPQNVMLTSDRNTVKLGDFGLAYSLMDAIPALTVEGTVGGTPGYMAPEVFEGDFYDPRSDIYSLGVMMYEILTGRLPFSAASTLELCNKQRNHEPDPPSGRNKDISPDLDFVVLKSLSKSTEQRFQTPGEFLWALEQILSPQSVALLPGPVSASKNLLSRGSKKNKKITLQSNALEQSFCPQCNEPLPPQLARCPFCDSAPLASWGSGDTSVVLLPKQDCHPFRLLVQSSEFLGSVRTYPMEEMDTVMDIIKESTGTLHLDRDEAFNRMSDLPCSLVETLDSEDADILRERLEKSGVKVNLKPSHQGFFSFLERKKYSSNSVRSIFSLGAMTALSGFMVFSLFFMEKMLLGYFTGSLNAMIAGGALVAASIPMIAGPVWVRSKNRPLSNLSRLLDTAGSRSPAPLSEKVLHQAMDILPRLKDPTIRKIAVNIMRLLAKVRVLLPDNEHEKCDTWLSTSLNLAISAQMARDSRVKLKQTTSDIIKIAKESAEENVSDQSVRHEEALSEQSALAQKETHFMTRLLQIRARVERLLASQQLAQADRRSDTSELEQAMNELEIQVETVREMDEFQ